MHDKKKRTIIQYPLTNPLLHGIIYIKHEENQIIKDKVMNAKIQTAREIGIRKLGISRQELDHALEFHKDAFVMEPFGFTPCGFVPPELLDECCGVLEYRNVHEQYYMLQFMEDPELYKECREAWEASGVDALMANSGVECNEIPELIKRLSRRIALPDRYPELYMRAVSPRDFLEAKKQNKIGLCFSTNGVPISHPVTVEESLAYIAVFYQFGVRMMHFTYNRRNLLGDGCAEEHDGGLSDFGRRAVKEMNAQGMIIDIAHSGELTSFEAAELSTKPVMASHTVMKNLSGHHRGKSDEVCRMIAAKGGLIGICAYPKFLKGTGDICEMLRHIDYAVEHFGADHVAIGTDQTYHCGTHRPCTRPIHSRGRYENLRKEDPAPFTETEEMRLSLAWTNFPLLTAGMLQHGHSEEDIRKILGLNVLRVLETAHPDTL